MNDLSILILYVIVFALIRSAGSLLALLVWCAVAYTSYELVSKYTLDDVYSFLILSVVYAMCAVQLRKWRDSAWVGCVFVSLYYLYFSYDSWINWEVETWTYQNHESIVFAAHILVMLLLISVRLTVVSARLNLFWNNRCNSKTK
jgi:hypothetical protein